jgi:uncharacterized protein with NRDE domain
MCLIVLAWKYHPEFPLVVAANRDEFTDRPTQGASFWPEAPYLLAGRDLVGGGTWLGITRPGRFAAITNYRDPSPRRHGAPSRGRLVSDFLLGDETPGECLSRIAKHGGEYDGFNLLAADGCTLFYLSNRQGRVRPLAPGIYGLSNGFLDTPWPKVVRTRAAMAAALENPEGPDPEALFAILSDTTRAHDGDLPQTGIGLEWERLLSAPFIAAPGYGTRASTVLLVDGAGVVDFRERTITPGAPAPSRERAFRFRLDA